MLPLAVFALAKPPRIVYNVQLRDAGKPYSNPIVQALDGQEAKYTVSTQRELYTVELFPRIHKGGRIQTRVVLIRSTPASRQNSHLASQSSCSCEFMAKPGEQVVFLFKNGDFKPGPLKKIFRNREQLVLAIRADIAR